MNKLRLDYFFSKGGKLVDGDVFIDTTGRRVAIGIGNGSGRDQCGDTTANKPCVHDSKRFIESFEPRKNKGVMPCDGDFPVVANLFHRGISGDSYGCLAKDFRWDFTNKANCYVEFWQPDINALIEMQNEHDATVSKMETVEPKPSVYTQAMADAAVNFANEVLSE